jgi:dTDP-4-amino-4,6-dideoxygalactose transaminase
MNAYAVVAEFEKRVAEFAGARFGVAVDCCTSAIFLSLLYLEAEEVICPARTYISVPMAIRHAGAKVVFEDFDWRGVYQLKPYPLYDGAKRFRRAMYRGGFHCLSFHHKKHLPIGRGGMILTDDEKAVAWLKKARYDGREGKPYHLEKVSMMGYHCYMTPEQAARGLTLMDTLAPHLPDLTEDYPDLRQMPVFQ